ncbi:ABC transporter permease [Streptomyces sp. OfavH-34-F]|uniref:ABC transporter permease n=1 Tax=Streptomyces sp. OfavH-34-F TaxID=2917760 RepID=UPI001EF1B867|nr:ABC transporter permease [Streptomyces sp. OfavH-34-F]MCG7527190.1 ABC transporter permease [Streptomyces sp. OfavH-34-F]
MALLLATAVLSVVLAGLAAVHAVYAEKEERRVARTPVVQEDATGKGSTTWLVGSDSLQNKRRFNVVFLAPHEGDAPLPPGVDHWPAPGEAVLSPELRKAGAGEDIDHRYGDLAGVIQPSGLDEPTEWLAYVRPRDGLSGKSPNNVLAGFGPAAQGIFAPGLEPGSGRDDDKAEWMFQSAVAGLLGLPALALLVIAVRTGAHARDRRTALIAALGGRRTDRTLVAIGEAAQPALLGTLLGAAVVAWAMLTNLRIPFTDYILSSEYLRQYGWLVGPTPVAALAVVLTVVVVAELAPRRSSTGTRPHSPTASRWLPRFAGLFPVMFLIAVRGPDFVGSDSGQRTLVGWAGIAGTVLTLPAAIATATAAAGPLLTRWGQSHGLAGTLVAGRRTTSYPGSTARLVTGIVVGLIVLMQAVAWQGLFGAQSTDAQRTLDRIGTSALSVGVRGQVSDADMTAFLDRLPDNTKAVLLAGPVDGSDGNGPMRLYGDCPALAALHLKCPARTDRLSGPPQDPRLQEMVRWTPHGPLQMDIHRTSGPALAHRAAASTEESAFVLVRNDGRTISASAIKKLAHQVLPRGARASAPGEDELTAGIPNRDQGRWSTLLGLLGVTVLTLAAGISAMAEFLRHGRALAPLSVLTGGLHAFRTSAAWTVFMPLVLAGLAGSAVAAGLADPVSESDDAFLTRQLTLSAAVAVLAIGVLMWAWASTVSVKQARSWRPRGD